MNNLATIILAAGNSSRLGQSKQLLKKNNESLLIRTIRLAMQNTPQVFCILGNEASSLSTIIESEVVKKHNPNVHVVAVEPENSPVISGGEPGPHKIQGIGAGFIPTVLNTEIFDEVIQVSDADAFATSKELAKTDGLLVGISAGANLYVAKQVASRPENKGKTIVTILCDTGERYLSTTLYS